MEWGEILKAYGPQAVPWIFLAFLGKLVLDRMDRWTEASVKLATALEMLSERIEKMTNGKNGN